MRITSVLVLVFGALALGGCEEKKTEATPEPSAKAAAGDAKKDDKKAEAKRDKKDDKDDKDDKDGDDKKEEGEKKDKEDDGGW